MIKSYGTAGEDVELNSPSPIFKYMKSTVAENADRFDLVFSDVMMPGGTNGIDLAREVRQRRPELPILLTSGFADSIGSQAQELDIPVLRKPYSLEDLRAAVQQPLIGRGHQHGGDAVLIMAARPPRSN